MIKGVRNELQIDHAEMHELLSDGEIRSFYIGRSSVKELRLAVYVNR